MKHQLDATLCRFYFCRVILHVSGASAHHQEYLKPVQRPLVHVLSLQVSHHISLLGPELNAYQLCRNKTCTVLHQVGVSFDLFLMLPVHDSSSHKKPAFAGASCDRYRAQVHDYRDIFDEGDSRVTSYPPDRL